MAELTVQQKESVIHTINEILQSKELSTISGKELEFVTKSLIVDKIKDELKTELKKSRVNIEEIKKNWLSLFNSKSTIRVYNDNLDIFFNWLAKREKSHIVSLKAIDADEYLIYLKKNNQSGNTIRLRISVASSFVSYLNRLEILNSNPFFRMKGIPSKKLEIKSHDEIPTNDEMNSILEEIRKELFLVNGKGYRNKVRAARYGIVAVSIVRIHGLRVGALENLSIDRNGNYSSLSKGKTVKGRLDPEIINLIKEIGLNPLKPFEIKVSSIKVWFERFNKRMVRDKKLDKVFSFHDIRHYAAIQFYGKTKDLYLLKKFLNHSSLTSTQVYLSSLNIEIYGE